MVEPKMHIGPIQLSRLMEDIGYKRHDIFFGGVIGIEGDWETAVTRYAEEVALEILRIQVDYDGTRVVPQYQARSRTMCMTVLRDGEAYVLGIVGRTYHDVKRVETKLLQIGGFDEIELYLDISRDRDMMKALISEFGRN